MDIESIQEENYKYGILLEFLEAIFKDIREMCLLVDEIKRADLLKTKEAKDALFSYMNDVDLSKGNKYDSLYFSYLYWVNQNNEKAREVLVKRQIIEPESDVLDAVMLIFNIKFDGYTLRSPNNLINIINYANTCEVYDRGLVYLLYAVVCCVIYKNYIKAKELCLKAKEITDFRCSRKIFLYSIAQEKVRVSREEEERKCKRRKTIKKSVLFTLLFLLCAALFCFLAITFC